MCNELGFVLCLVFSAVKEKEKKKEREIKTTAVFSHAAIVSILQSHMIGCPGGVACGKVSKYVSQFFFFVLKGKAR